MGYKWCEILNCVSEIADYENGSLVGFICDKTVSVTTLPKRFKSITSISAYAFSSCKDLALTSLPEGITSIDSCAFQGCTNLALTSLPESITSIGTLAFQACTKLTTLTFKGTPTSIVSNAFLGCNRLTTINVPWAEGEVENAPWGATKATINYNYIGE